MKNFVILISFIFLVSVLSAQQQDIKASTAPAVKNTNVKTPAPATQTVAVNNPNAPVITFEKVEHDYGKINEGDDGNCVFKFKNTGKEPLIITNAKSSCGCTVPEWTTEPVMPGKSGEIKVKYDTKRKGVISKSITITSNAKNATVELKIKGEVLAKATDQSLMKNIDPASTPVNK